MIVFLQHPQSINVGLGETAEFSIELDLGALVGAASRQWYRSSSPDGSGAVALSGETGDELVIEDVQLADAGYYFCRVTDDVGTADSALAALNGGSGGASAAVWRGSQGIHLQPTYPRFYRDARGCRLTFVFRGPYADLKTFGPSIGDDFPLSAFGFEPNDELVYCESIETHPLEAGDGGPGELTIIYGNEAGGGTLSGDAEAPTYEIDVGVLEKRLETHPRYNNGAGSPFAPYGFTAGTTAFTMNSGEPVSIADFWDRYKSAPVSKRPELRGEIPPGAAALLAMLDELTQKFMSGIESYVVPAPIARKTSRSYAKPVTAAFGARGAPVGFPDLPAGYEWLKTADRAQRQGTGGKYERVEEWTGADKWDAHLYPAV